METKKYQLPKEFATKWVEALRSGDFKQTTGQLKRGDCYCAIGVCALVNDFEFQGEGQLAYKDGISIYTKMDLTNQTLDFPKDIFRMNDTHKKPFIEIANYIEKNVEFI